MPVRRALHSHSRRPLRGVGDICPQKQSLQRNSLRLALAAVRRLLSACPLRNPMRPLRSPRTCQRARGHQRLESSSLQYCASPSLILGQAPQLCQQLGQLRRATTSASPPAEGLGLLDAASSCSAQFPRPQPQSGSAFGSALGSALGSAHGLRQRPPFGSAFGSAYHLRSSLRWQRSIRRG